VSEIPLSSSPPQKRQKSCNEAFVVSSIQESQQELQQRFQELGYLFIKNYVSSEKCDSLLRSFIEVLDPHISLKNVNNLPASNGAAFSETDPVWDEVYPKMQSMEEFHSFFHDTHIQTLMKTVAGKDVFVYPMKMARISTPGKIGYETPPHQDGHSHNAGPTMAGIWVALHDVSDQMGRLKILPASHKKGIRPVFSAEGVGGVQCEIYEEENTWHVSDVEKGDVIIFHSATVHKAEPNTSEIYSRISVDTRFCDFGAPVFSLNLEPHHGWRIAGLCWDEIYKGWQQPKMQYYWKDYPNLF
jgi:ectoine hydroxylase-related dioxygenase (phytanoyl-CoA dioxygenase family)